MSRHDHHGEKELAAFIRAGAERRPEQAYGDYFKGKYASCALGAAYEGMYRLPEQADGTRPTKDPEWSSTAWKAPFVAARSAIAKRD